MSTGYWIRTLSVAAGMTLLSALVVAFAGLFTVSIVPAFGAEGGGTVPDASRLSHGIFLAGYLLLAVGTVASAVVATVWRWPGPAPTVSGAVVGVGVVLVAVGTRAMLGDSLVLPTAGFLSVGIPPSLLVVAYTAAASRQPERLEPTN